MLLKEFPVFHIDPGNGYSEVWPEIPRRLHKTLEMLSQRRIPNSDYTINDLEGLMKSLIARQRRSSRTIEVGGGWSLVDIDNGMPGGVAMEVILYPTYMVLSLMTLFWYRYAKKARRLKGFREALHKGMFVVALHRRFTGFGLDTKALLILKMGKVFRYVADSVNEHDACRALQNVLIESRKEIDERYFRVSPDIPSLHKALAILPDKTSWKTSDHFTWRRQCTEDSNCIVIVETPYATTPKGEVHTDTIAHALALTQRVACILGIFSKRYYRHMTSRAKGDSFIVSEYRRALLDVLKGADALDQSGKAQKKVLHLVIRGLGDHHEVDFEICTRRNRACNEYVSKWFRDTLEKILALTSDPWHSFLVLKSRLFGGGSQYLEVNRNGEQDDTDFPGFGDNYNAMEIRISTSTRITYRDRVIDIIGELIDAYRHDFSYRA